MSDFTEVNKVQYNNLKEKAETKDYKTSDNEATQLFDSYHCWTPNDGWDPTLNGEWSLFVGPLDLQHVNPGLADGSCHWSFRATTNYSVGFYRKKTYLI